MKKVKLDYPIKKPGIMGIGDVIVEAVNVRRPTVKDMLGLVWIPPHDQASFRTLVARLTEMPIAVIDQIDMKDYQIISDCINEMWRTR